MLSKIKSSQRSQFKYKPISDKPDKISNQAGGNSNTINQSAMYNYYSVAVYEVYSSREVTNVNKRLTDMTFSQILLDVSGLPDLKNIQQDLILIRVH